MDLRHMVAEVAQEVWLVGVLGLVAKYSTV